MRLWHQDLISLLPRQQLLGQHRECCALRGNGWGKKHSVVDYVFENSYFQLFKYHKLIMEEMVARGYNVNKIWHDSSYRGKVIGYVNDDNFIYRNYKQLTNKHIYAEHDDNYLHECLQNLKGKGIEISISIQK